VIQRQSDDGADCGYAGVVKRSTIPNMGNALPRNDYLRLLYEQAAREQRQLAERVRAARGDGALIADFERRAAKLEKLARPYGRCDLNS
jgi:hypothetical protein